MVDHRLKIARKSGCDIAASTAVTGGASERNLMRLGFHPLFQITTYEQRPSRTTETHLRGRPSG
jgi:hypothetical protein